MRPSSALRLRTYGTLTGLGLLLGALTLPSGSAAPAPPPRDHDWGMFGRDATRNAVSPEKNAPLLWNTSKTGRANVLWAAALGGGHACGSPVVAGDFVWV